MRNNSKASNKPLEAILRVNATRRPFEWLVHGDDDTCFALERLAAFLRKLDARAPWFLSSTCHGPAHRVPPGGPRCCDLAQGAAPGGCRAPSPWPPDAAGFAPDWTFAGRAVWPFGGDGFAISRGLLDKISRAEWQACVDGISSGGGDSRVAHCIWYWSGVGLARMPKSFSEHRYFERTDRAAMDGASARVDRAKARACLK